MHAQLWLWGGAGGAALLAVGSGLADHRRHNRRTLDDIGWVPWRGIQVAAIGAGLVLLSFAIRA